MKFMLDSNICIGLMRGKLPQVFRKLRSLEPDEAGISAITLAELQCGAAKSNRPEHHQSLIIAMCAPLEIAPFDSAAAETYGRVRAQLEAVGKSIGPLDTLIASHAISVGAILITDNLREFRRVVDLDVRSWTNL